MRQACHILSCNLSCKDSPLSESTALDSQESHLPGLLVLAPVPFPHPNFPPLAKTWIAVLLYLPMAILIKIKHSLARKKKKKIPQGPCVSLGSQKLKPPWQSLFFPHRSLLSQGFIFEVHFLRDTHAHSSNNGKEHDFPNRLPRNHSCFSETNLNIKIQLLTHAKNAWNGFLSILLSFSLTLQNNAYSLHKKLKRMWKYKGPERKKSPIILLSEATTTVIWECFLLGYFSPDAFFTSLILILISHGACFFHW